MILEKQTIGFTKTATVTALASLFLFFVFFPYLTIIPLGTDLQPYALLVAVALLTLVSSWRWPAQIWLLAGPIVASLLIGVVQLFSFSALRGIGAYATPFFVAGATYAVLRARPRLVDNFIKYVPYIWLAVGLIQATLDQEFMKALLPNMSLDPDRGVTGLATEPSFYGIFCLFLLVLNYLRNSRDKLVAFVLLFQILFLAKSSVAVFSLVTLLLYFGLVNLSIKQIALCAIVMVGGYYAIVTLFPDDWRIVTLTSALLQDPSLLLLTDTSVNSRFGHFLFSTVGFFQDGLMPHGYGSFTHYVKEALAVRYPEYVWLGSLDDDLKIMSGYGSALFELGFVGLLYLVSLTVASYKYFRGDVKSFLVLTAFVHTIMFAAVQMSLPLLGLLIGYLSFYGHANRKKLKQIDRRELPRRSVTTRIKYDVGPFA